MTTKPAGHLALGLVLATGISSQGLAADKASAADEPEEAPSVITGTVEYGPGYISDDSYRFGRYTGMDDEGIFANGGFDLHFRPGRPDFLHLQGYNLGLESRRLSIEYGEQGRYETHLEYRELPSFKMDSAQTPYQNPGHDNLVVAPGGSPTVLRPFELDTKRKRLSGGISYFPRKDWKTSLEFSHEKKDGTDWIGGALLAPQPGGGGGGGGGPGTGFGRTYAVILPEPIDQTTTDVDASLEYNGEQSQWRLNLHGSFFDNDYSSLRWANPGFDTSGVGGGGGGGGGLTLPDQGQLALAPDNQFYQLTLSGAGRLTDTTRFTGALSVGLMQQDEDFLPYGIDGSAAATATLPRSSLDGEVYVYSARAGITARPLKPLRLKAQYRYDERDNDTPQAAYTYDRLESGTASPTAITNNPLSYKKHKAILGANYRFSSMWSGSADYEYRDTEREYSDVEESNEHIGKAGLKWRPRDDFDAALRLGMSSRDASDYQAELEKQNPLLRKYTLADRDRDQAGLLLNYAPMSNLNIGFSTDLVEDDYTDSDLGLTDADSHNYNLDVSYIPAQDIRLHAFYSHERIESRQLGSPTSGSFYRVDYDDQIDTLGMGANFDNVWKSWDLGVSYRYSKGIGEIDYTGLSAGTASNSYPDLENELHHLELSAAYDLKENTRVKFSAIYESMRTDDWALDGIPPYPDRHLLTLGNDTEEYDVFAFMVALQHHF